MKPHKIAASFLALTSVLHLYQHFLIVPSKIWLAMWVFGIIYLVLAYFTLQGRALKLAIIIPLFGAFMALVSVFQGEMSLLPWTLLFVTIDIFIASFAYLALKGKDENYPKREANAAPINNDMHSLFSEMKGASRQTINPSLDVRRDRLNRLLAMTAHHKDEIIAAINADFGRRSAHLTDLSEVITVMTAIKHAKSSLSRNMKTKRIRTGLNYLPGSNRRISHPKGVVGIMSPWNYPYQLAIMPTIDAIAAGNRVMIKPSETAPQTSSLLQSLIHRYFTSDEIAVVTGELQVSKDFATLPFDHLLFTGSTRAGTAVAEAAAKNLTPVTLELGGKSPALILEDANLEKAAASIAFGRLFNSGQTCISPDYVLINEALQQNFVTTYTDAVKSQYPTLANNPDYTLMVNERFAARMRHMVEDAKAKGAIIIEINPANETLSSTCIAPHVILNVSDDMLIMQEEIFGPLLPVKSVNYPAAISYINAKDRPLSLYIYGEKQVDETLQQVVAGGVTVNDCIWHMVQEGQPFGGIGASGQGAYHGDIGFKTFSHEMPVFKQGFINSAPLLRPPYGKAMTMLMNYLRKAG
jgi:coniferyl-aldehyde dehydrogenase